MKTSGVMVESKKIPDPARNKPLVPQQISKAFQTINRWVEVPGVCSFRALLEFSQFVVLIFAESLLVGGFNHLKNILVKLDHFPNFRGENKKSLNAPPSLAPK